jgi:hypothetical protein
MNTYTVTYKNKHQELNTIQDILKKQLPSTNNTFKTETKPTGTDRQASHAPSSSIESQVFASHKLCLLPASCRFLLGLLFSPQDRSDTFVGNVS